MKKLIYCAAALAAMIFAGSCQRENLEPVAQEATVTLSVELPGVQTKTIGDGFNVDQLVYEVWKTEKAEETDLNGQGKATRLYQETATMAKLDGEQKTVISLNLVHDQNYTILFWAQNSKAIKDAPAYNTDDLTAVTYANSVTDGSYFSNNENMAAFYNIAFLTAKEIEKPTTKRVELKRPFAQLNIGTMNTAEEYTVTMNKSKVTISNVPTVFNVAQNTPQTPAVSELKSFVFNYGNVPSEPTTLTVNTTPYQYVAMNYIFAGNENVKVYYKIDATLTAKDTKAETTAYVENKVIEVPLKENYRTNIVGNLLTSTTKYEVVIDADWAWNEGDTPEWEGNHIEVWNGTELNAPTKNDANQYVIEYPSELAWLAAAVNGTLPETRAKVEPQTFAGETFVLAADVDLNNFEWTPIGNSDNPFKGTFDGNGKTVKNLLITGNNSNVGLFGMTTDGEIKNLVVENAKVSGRLNVGVVAGTPYTSKYTDITVQGHVEVNGMAYVGGVGGKNAYADWSDITVNVDKTSYVKANSVENGTAYRTYVGGVVGFNGEGGHSFKNITSNINVEGSTCDVGGLFGIAHYGNQFENLTCEGNVAITTAGESAEAEEIGGIAGVWNNGGSDVVMNNVSFKGEVTTNIERETVWYGNLFGKPYSAAGKGKLIVDGVEMFANGIGMKNDEYYVTSAQGLVWVEAQADNFFAGKTIKLANDIDMDGVTIANPITFWNGRTTFDGQNYTISNLTMSTASTEKKPFGLFGGTADIKNVKFDNANISGYSYVAVVAGNLYGNIENCHVSNSSVTCTYWMAGALSGQYNSGNVTNCTVTRTTVTGPAAVGALVGNINETAGERKVENCTVTGCTITQNGSFGGDYDKMFAAAVGLININNSKVYFTNCTIENTTVKGTESTDLFGLNGGDETIVYVNGNEVVTNGVTKDSEGNYYISSADGLRWVADVVNATTPYTATLFDGKTVKLMNDIDLKNEEWIPIGDDRSQRTEFHGIFDGQGYTVKNVKITKKTDRVDENKSSYGLFGNLKGTVKNLTVENVSISGAPKFIGALVGRMNDGLIENCHVKNSSVECENWTIGGLVGQLNNGKISGCSVEGTTVKGYGAVAGIVGIALASGERTIEDCSVKNTILVQNGFFGGDYDKMFGAIVGAIYSQSLTVNLNNCSVEGTTIKEQDSNSLCGFISEGGKLIIDGAPVVSSTAALSEAIGQGKSVILANDVDFGTTQLTITGANQVVDLAGHALTTANNWGGITLKNGATIKNGTITHAGNTAAIKAFDGTSVENVTINATCSTADKTVTGIAVQQGAHIESIKNVTINGVSQGIEVGYQATVDLIENAVVNESNNGTAKGIGLVINGGKVGRAKNCTFKGETYGVTMHLKGIYNVGLELQNCSVEGATASIYAWDEKGISNTSGSLTLTYDAATTLTGPFVWDFEDECKEVVTLNRPE